MHWPLSLIEELLKALQGLSPAAKTQGGCFGDWFGFGF